MKNHQLKQQLVTIREPFYLSVHEVTQKAFNTVMGRNTATFSPTGISAKSVSALDSANSPIETVTWNEAVEFCVRLSQAERLSPCYGRQGTATLSLSGAGYRLPMESEWEFACRAGTTSHFSTGDADIDKAAWYTGNSDNQPHPVALKDPNPFGLFDMHGNVLEWMHEAWWESTTEDWPLQPTNQTRQWSANASRIARGGAYLFATSPSHWSSFRKKFDGATGRSEIGFRPLLSVDAVRPGRSALAAKASAADKKSAKPPIKNPKPATAQP